MISSFPFQRATRSWLRFLAIVSFGWLITIAETSEVTGQDRSSTGIVALYDFANGESASEQPATPLIRSIKGSGSFTVEAWVRPKTLKQTGPARIVTLSRNTSERNFTLGQEGDKFEVRLRTTKTSTNGIPALSSKPGSLKTDWTYVAYTFDGSGEAALYVNGKLNAKQAIGGSLSNWDDKYPLTFGNEPSGDRPWNGGFRLVAVFDRALSPSEVEQHFKAGSESAPMTEADRLAHKRRENERLFELRIAPILSTHCLECHDSLNQEGDLDLSRKVTALAGSGGHLLSSRVADSVLWQQVVDDEMPLDRSPLSSEEKQWLKQWLEGGAEWSLDFIDSAVYAHGDGAQKTFVQRLTVPEYVESVRSTLGVDIENEARELLPVDVRADGFRNTAYNLTVDLAHIEAYAKLAELIVDQVDIAALAKKYTKSRELTDENLTTIIEPLGLRLLRGPVSKVEVTRYCGVSTSVAGAGGDFEEALRYILQAMLQSPRFLYRIEHQPGDGVATPVSDYELASRLSYIVWGAPPDDELLKAAEKGALDGDGLKSQVQRMLKDSRAIARSRQFVSQWLNLDRLSNLRPDPERFPNWDSALADDMREETLAYFEEVLWNQSRPLSDLLNAQVTFVTPRLARHYDLPLDGQVKEDQRVRYDLSEIDARGGLLTHGSVLTVGGDEASMVARGLFVMQELLRGIVRDPPPGVDTAPVPSKPGLTQRAVSETRLVNQSCTGCHAKFEPLAFGLEKFDGRGAFHDKDEHGNPLRDDGNILFPGAVEPIAFESSAELMDLLAASERVRETFTWKLTQFAVGRPLGATDAPILASIHREAQENGATYASLLTAIITSELVRMTHHAEAENERP